MRTPARDDWSGPGAELDRLMASWRHVDVVRRAHEIVREHTDPYIRIQARLFDLAARFNLGQAGTPLFDHAIQQARTELDDYPEPVLVAEYHAMYGIMAAGLGELDTAIRRVAAAHRELSAVSERSLAATIAWLDVSALESTLGLTDHATHSKARADDIDRYSREWLDIGLLLESALVRDHHGDTAACVRQLDQAVDHALRRLDGSRVGPGEEIADFYSGFALARRAALGGDLPVCPGVFFPPHRRDAFTECFRKLTKACLAIARGETNRALVLLDSVPEFDPIVAVDVLRLRALALVGCGEHASAWSLERDMFRRATENIRRMQRLVVDGAGAAKDHAALTEALRTGSDVAFTDAMTGIPNRRHFEILRSRLARADSVVVGMLDLDNFKAVNTTHGHRVGDAVLARAATVLRETLRGDDFLARYGGDEFIAVLVRTSLSQAHRLGERMRARLARENWDEIAPGSSIGVTIGWSPLAPGTDFDTALRAADSAMYAAKSAC